MKKGIGYSPLTDKVYLGKQNKEKGMWIGEKEDITNEFLAVSMAFFEENTIRTIGSENSSNLIFNVSNNKKGIENGIKTLQKELKKLETNG